MVWECYLGGFVVLESWNHFVILFWKIKNVETMCLIEIVYAPSCSAFGKRSRTMWPCPSEMVIFSWKVHERPKKLCSENNNNNLEGSMGEGYLAN